MTNKDLSQPQRQRTSVAIQGLDRSTPDDIVTDGKCQELHNLRFKDNAWRPVHPHKVKYYFRRMPHLVTQLYSHPATGSGKFIVRSVKNMLPWDEGYYLVDVNGNSSEIASFTSPHSISHFGNVLMLEGGSSSSYFLWKDNSYIPFSVPAYALTSIVDEGFSSRSPELVQQNTTDVGGGWVSAADLDMDDITGGLYRASWFPIFNYTQGYSCISQTETGWTGEALIFTTFRMHDGTSLSPSPLHLVKSNGAYKESSTYSRKIGRGVNPKEFYERWTKGESTDDLDQYLYIQFSLPNKVDATVENRGVPLADPSLRMCTPTLRIRIPATSDVRSMESIALWGTRILPIYHEEQRIVNGLDNYRVAQVKASNSFVDYYADNDLANQQFYLLKEIDLSNLKKEKAIHPETLQEYETGYLYTDVILTYSLFNNAIQAEKYSPLNNTHSVHGKASLDYNNRLHLADLRYSLSEGYHISDSDIGNTDEPNIPFYEWVEVHIDNAVYTPVSLSYKYGRALKDGTPFSRIVSYPDFRARKFGVEEHFIVSLREAPANNFAWHHEPHTTAEKFPPISLNEGIIFPDDLADNRIVLQPNKISVSAPNNPFSFPFENSYVAGSSNNHIVALQSGAIETHEMKVGELPLYVFTEEGIFALIAGQNTLYSSVVAINYDKIINPNTLAINGAIVYITEKGVHLLTSQGSQIISSPIHGEDGMPDLEFLKSCKILYPKQYNEFALYNDSGLYPSAFIFNLDTGYWSTRTLTGRKLNTDELYYDTKIYDLGDEDETKFLPVAIQTRPIKLGNVELKRLETIIPRFQVGNSHPLASMSIDGSIDGSTYMRLRAIQPMEFYSRLNPFVIRRTPFSAKYFKLYLDFTPIEGEDYAPSITNIDFEWYARFVRRMR